MADVKFSQFTVGNEMMVGDIPVGLRPSSPTLNFQFNFPGAGIRDAGGNYLFEYATSGLLSVNHLKLINALTTVAPIVTVDGTDTNIDLAITPKGTGALVLDHLRWPIADGAPNTFLFTDGSGNLAFGTPPVTGLSFAPIGSTPNAEGASISAGVITLQPADASFGGLVTTTTQTIAGLKTFNTGITVSGGNITLGADSFVYTIDIGTGTGSGTAINIGTGSVTELITIGNLSGATALSQFVGSGGWTVDGQGGSSFSIGASITTGAISIGGVSQTGAITLGNSNAASIVNIAHGTGPTTLNIADNTSGGSVNVLTNAITATFSVGGSAGTGLITLGSSTGTNTVNLATGTGTGIINIGTGAGNPKTINIATANVANVVAIGSLGTSTSLIGSVTATNIIEGYTTTVTAGATTTLTVFSTYQQFFTGTTTQTVLMPVASTLILGQSYYIVNNSTGSITIESSGGNLIQTMVSGTFAILTCILTSGTTAASWNVEYVFNGGTGSVNPSTQNNLGYYATTGATISGLATANSASLVTSSAGAPSWLTLTSGQIIIGSTGATPVAATLTAGNGIAIANTAGAITISTIDVANTWIVVTGTTQAMAVNTGYVSNNASLVTLTLPATAAVGSIIQIQGLGAGGWKIAQNASQLIHIGSQVTTTGVTGFLSSTNQYDSLTLLCVVANTTWCVLGAAQGNITFN